MALKNKVVILGKINEGMTNPNDISKSTGIPQSTVYRVVKKIRSGDGIFKQKWVKKGKKPVYHRRNTVQNFICGEGYLQEGSHHYAFSRKTWPKSCLYAFWKAICFQLYKFCTKMGGFCSRTMILNTATYTTYTKQWLRDNDVRVIEWPSYSPDLNPVENILRHLKRELYKRNCEKIEELKHEAVATWDSMSHEFVQSYVTSMPTRINLCIQRQGEKISY